MSAENDPHEQKNPARKRRRRRRRRGPKDPSKGNNTPQPKDVEGAARAALKALGDLGEALLYARGIQSHQLKEGMSLNLNMDMILGPGAPQARQKRVKSLIEGLERQFETAFTAKIAFIRGAVYCYRCETATCQHATPPDPINTFAGYSPTGQPLWVDLPNLFIDFGDDRVDRLYERDPDILGLVLMEEELTGKLLPAFRETGAAYRILGQVSAGLISDAFYPPSPDSNILALTTQIVETRGPKGLPRLRLNLLGATWDQILEAAAEADPRHPPERLRRALKQAKEAVDKIGRRMSAADRSQTDYDPTEDIYRILSRLCSDFERMFSRNKKRTKHAHTRHLQVSRPTANALSDAKKASQERLLFDVKRETIVVLGPRGRIHLFSKDARHVTSLSLQPGELERRLSRGRWRMLSLKHSLEFKLKLGAQNSPDA